MPRRKTIKVPAASELRAWAKEAGLEVGTRGRISQAVVTAYIESQKSAAK